MENAENSNNMGNNTFTVTPTNQQITLDPGQVYEGYITVINASGATGDLHYEAVVTPYSVLGLNYSVDLANESARTSISKWITIEEPTGTIKPNEAKDLKFTITVPENAPIGGQYATIAISSNEDLPQQEGFNIQSVLEIASVIYANVNGEIIHSGEVQDVNIPGFAFATPISVGATIINNGNTHEIAHTTLTVNDYFSGRLILPSDQESGRYDDFVMPETTYYSSHDLPELAPLGVYKISQTISYGETDLHTEKVLVVCPLWLIVLAIITLAAIITAIVLLIRKHRRRKRLVV